MRIGEPDWLDSFYRFSRTRVIVKAVYGKTVCTVCAADGGVRKPGIPTVVDRMIKQAVRQVLQGRWNGRFSEHSYGFRPGRSAHQAVEAAQQYIAAGHRWCVDLDLEKFFDRVSHDKLMAKIAARVSDKRRSREASPYPDFCSAVTMSEEAGCCDFC